MSSKRIIVLLLCVLLGSLIGAGCHSGNDMVDRPLMDQKDVPPTPPRPDKPSISPSAGGGAQGPSAAKTTQ